MYTELVDESILLTDTVDESIFLKNLEKFPELANENPDDLPSCFFEEEMFSLEEWGAHFEQQVYERLGFRIKISSSE